MINSRKKGFTLIELLVVVSIIGLLSSVVLTSLNSARAKARNVKRNADIIQLTNAINLAFDANGTWPDNGASWACLSTTCTSSSAVAAVDAAIAPYIQKSVDPAGTAGYIYSKYFGGYDATACCGNFFPEGGPYLNWFMEGSSLYQGACGRGGAMSVGGGLIQCLLKID